jgi:type 1 glutamine amidotransferase
MLPLAAVLLAAAPAQVVFVAGHPNPKLKPGEHEYRAGCLVLADLARQSGLTAAVHAGGWPSDPAAFDAAAAVVLFFEGGDKSVLAEGDHLAQLEKLSAGGTGLVFLHSAVDVPAAFGERVRRLAGGVWLKAGGKRAHWVATFDRFPDHPLFRGVTPFTIDDGWLWNNRREADAVPLLRTVGPKDNNQTTADGSVVAWAYDPPGRGRAVAFTGGHLHDSLKLAGYRQFLANATVWAAGREVPPGGVPAALDPAELTKNLDPKPAKK